SILIVLLLKLRSSPKYTLFPYTTLFRSVRAAADVLELVPRAPVHAEVEEDEVRPGVDRVVEDVDALVRRDARGAKVDVGIDPHRSEEHTSELQSPCNLVCRLLLEKKKIK